MADADCSRQSRSTRSSTEGFTLIELLVAFALASVLMGIALTLAMSSREVLTTDEHRTRMNQNLRSALDLIGIDARQAGERLPADFPAVEIVDGVGGAPDRLVVRRNMLDEVLPVCQSLVAGVIDDEVRVAIDTGVIPRGCEPVPDDDADGFPDNIGAWRTFRDALGGQLPVYVFNPVTVNGEWFIYDGDGSTVHELHKGNGDPWIADYPINQQSRIYVLEERHYRLSGGVLQFRINLQPDPVNVSTQIVDFQARAVMADGSVQDSFAATEDWTQLSAIEVTIEAVAESGAMNRRVTARFFPRNVLSN